MTRGFTLVEMAVVVLLLGLGAGLVALSLGTLRAPPAAEVLSALAEARAAAVRQGQPVAWRRDSAAVWFYADGSSNGGRVTLGGVEIAVDRLSGAVHAR